MNDACPACGARAQTRRFCVHCGARLHAGASYGIVQGPGASPQLVDFASTHNGAAVARPRRRRHRRTLALALVVAMLLVSALGWERVQSSGGFICLANPLNRTPSWPYDPSHPHLVLTFYDELHQAGPFAQRYVAAERQAFDAWTQAYPVVEFVPARSAASAEITLEQGWYGTQGLWHDHAGLTIPSVSMFGCSLTHAVIRINDSYLVHDGQLQYPEPMLRHLLAHEIGHALGLRHARSGAISIMVPTSDAYRFDRPQAYDIHTLATLYPPP